MTRPTAAAAVVLLVLTGVAYARAVPAGFIWDDDRHVTHNAALTAPGGLAAVWTTLDATPQYYPLTHTTFWIEHAIWGFSPRGYHIVNIALHAAAAVALWRLLVLLEVPGAWLAAAVFAVHPVHVESVAWISERKNVLSGLLALCSARVFLGWALGRSPGRAAPWWACLLFAGALLSKTVTASLPVALALVIFWKRGRLERRDVAWLVPMLIAGAAFGALTRHLEATQVGAFGDDWSLGAAARLALSGRIVLFYLGKLLWPATLVFVYPRWTIDAGAPLAWAPLAAVVAAIWTLWLVRRRIGLGPFTALAYFVVTLAPALGFFDVYPMRYSWVADHFQYLASIGPIALASAGTALGFRRLAAAWPAARRVGMGAAAVVIVVLTARTGARCGAYASEETLWRDTLRSNPSAWIAHNNLGILLAERGANAEAEAEFGRVLALRPSHSGALANLGYLQELDGRDADAAETLTRAAAARPEDADARTHLVRILVRLGRLDDALAPAVEAARLRPSDPDALCDAGTLLARAGRTAEAIPLLERAVTLRPGFARAEANLERARRVSRDVGYPRPPIR